MKRRRLFFENREFITPANAPAFRYPGGKAQLRKYIIRWCQLKGSTFCEPFAGRGNMLFLMRVVAKFQKWHLNDLQTIPFFKAILEYDGWQIEFYTKDEIEDMLEMGDPRCAVLEPLHTWAGGLSSGGAASTGTLWHLPSELDRHRRYLLRAKELLANVQLTELDACDVIEQYSNDPHAFLYVDPPYVGAKVESYDDGMINRKRMLRLLRKAKCKWLFSEYNSPDAMDAFGEPLAIIKNILTQTNNNRTENKRNEYLWANYEATPHVMEIKRGSAPLPISLSILKSAGSTTLEQWKKVTPKSWTDDKKIAQFQQMKRHPRCYFDGESIQLIR